METKSILDEFQHMLVEIEEQNKLRLFRKKLKFLLIGFFIGRDSQRRIAELTQEGTLIPENLFKSLEEISTMECIA